MSVEKPDWLPVDWKVSVKVRRDGKKDKYYIDPSTGLKFSSRPRVLRHLAKSSNGLKLKSQPDVHGIPNESKGNTVNKVGKEKTVARDLPPGWIKEVKTKRKKGCKARRNLYYIDPVSGRRFRSIPAIYRYLDSRKAKKPADKALSSSEAKGRGSVNNKRYAHLAGTIESGKKLASGSKRADKKNVDVPEGNNSKENEEDGSPSFGLSDKLQVLVNRVKQHVRETSKFKKLGEKREDTIVKADQRLKSVSPAGLKHAESKKEDLRVLEQRDGENDCVAGVLPNKSPHVNEKEQHQGGRRRSTRLLEHTLKVNVSSHSGSDVTGEKTVNMQESGSLVIREMTSKLVEEDHCLANVMDIDTRKNSKKKNSTSNLSCRTSKRLAQVEVDPSEEIKMNIEAQADEPEAEMSNGPGLSGERRADNPAKAGAFHVSSERRKNSKRKCSAGNLSCRTSKKLAVMEVHSSEDVKRNIIAPARYTETISRTRRADETRGDGPGKSCGLHGSSDASKQENAQSLNGGQEKSMPNGNISSPGEHKEAPDHHKEDDKQERNFDPSLEDLMMDPCIEFAVKTLTGAIPIEDLGKGRNNSPLSSLASPNQISGSSSALPVGDIWADPCFDFAVKMLTDEIPVTGGSNFHISFQPPVIPNNLAVTKFSLDNQMHPSNVSSVKDNIFHQSGLENCDGPRKK